MVYRFLRWLFGYLYIQLTGESTERFVNLCKNNQIMIWGLKQEEEGCFCYMKLKDYKRIRHIARKTRVIPYVKKRYGGPFLWIWMQKKRVFLAGALLFLLFLYLLSGRVWSITIYGEERYTEEQLLKYLRSTGVEGGMACKAVNCPGIEEAIRGEYKDIGWVSAELKGTYLRIKILENKVVTKEEEKKKPVHIVAAHGGTVQSIVTREGTPMVHRGDRVEKGDILISGVITVVGDNDTVVNKYAIKAEGDVVLETSLEYKDKIDFAYTKKVFTGKKFPMWIWELGGYRFYLYNPIKKFESFSKYDIMMSGETLKVGESFYLPASVTLKEYREITEEAAVYKQEEILLLAKRNYDRYVEKLQQDNVTIQKENIRYKIDKKACTVQGRVLVQESQTKCRKIKKDEWRMEETDGSEGDSHRDSGGT